ncbi:MAG: sulfotransferase [Phycisphaerales bacterium JB039]
MSPAPEQLHEQARRLMNAGEYHAAAAAYRQIVKAEPRNGLALGQLGACQTQLGETKEALRNLAKAVSLSPRVPELLHNLAFGYRAAGRLEEAIDAARRGLRLRPEDPHLRAALSEFLWTAGDLDAAWTTIDGRIGAEAHPALALAFARLCAKRGRADEGIATLERLTAEGGGGPLRMEMLFRLGDLLDRQGAYDRAFAAYSAGNALIRSHHDPAAFSAQIDGVIAAWDPEAVRSAVRSRVASETPALVLGMPRSGTTLVEQIIASHPEAAGAGELPFFIDRARELAGGAGGIPPCPAPGQLSSGALDRIGRSYLRELGRADPKAQRITDKQPLNFLYLGLIARAAPGARNVHCVRDPLDTCLSCFFKDFAGHVAAMASLESIGRFYRDYRRLMAHWRASLEIPVLDVVYEDLVADVEGQTRRLLEFIGLAFDERCLRFHENARVALTASVEQVRQPLYQSSVARWRNYEEHLGPLRAALGDVV